MSSIGENIKRIRKEKGFTQEELGARCNPKMAGSAIRRYENSDAIPKLATIQRIADGLDTAISNILTRDYLVHHPVTKKDWEDWIDTLGETKSDRINELFDMLNDKGKDKAIEQVELLTKIPEYTK